ncbi:hypothetical protein LTR17_021632 [Elasticomyces elasticus]|nr:hypothetical protein LTR17_021632 [Elasticomyces elasticus]
MSTFSSPRQLLAGQPVKRRRIGIACLLCRSRKSRCNGKNPCSLCTLLDAECIYETTDAPSAVTLNKSYVTNLETRIANLERKAQSSEKEALAAQPACWPRSCQHDQDESAPGHTPEIQIDKDHVHDLSPDEREDDRTASSNAPSTSSFFGPTSNVYLLRQIECVIRVTTQYPLAETLPDNDNLSYSNADSLAPHDSYLLAACWDDGLPIQVDHEVDPYVLPPTSRLSSMLDLFFADINSTWGYLYEPAFRDTFSHAHESGFKHVRRSWLGLLNVILAMVESRHNVDTESEASVRDASYMYFSRALVLTTRTMFQGPNLETVHGLAVKAAYTVGLHSKEDYAGLSERQREARKRAWWGCVNLDGIGLPEPIEMEVRAAADFDVKKAMSVSFLSASIGNLGLGDESNLNIQTAPHVFNLEGQLDTWLQSLPPGLEIHNASTVITSTVPGTELHHTERLSVILTLRHLNARILLRRPALTYALYVRVKGHIGLQAASSWQLLQSNLLERCLQSAEEIISILHLLATSGSPGKALLGAPWTTIYYAFNASLVMFGRILATPLPSMVESPVPAYVSKAGFCIKQAQEIVRNLDVDRLILDKCARYLARLSEVIETWVSRLNTNESSEFVTQSLELDQVFTTTFPFSESVMGFV